MDLMSNSRRAILITAICGTMLTAISATTDESAETIDNNLIAETSYGTVRGIESRSHIDIVAFRGIPYAQAPVGDLRWRLPQPPQAWEGVRDADEFGYSCPQPVIEEGFYASQPHPMNEDCLFLNVWTSSTSPNAGLPVMVWIHGGAFQTGSGSLSVYHGSSLANEGVVVVTLNYRLGVLGFFAHPALSAESSSGVSGNQGIHDQIAALRWVQDNIAAFGGDPSNVTIFGESAGSASVCYLVATPLAKGLFQRAIGQSAGCFAKHATLEESGDWRQGGALAVDETKAGYKIGHEIATALGATSEESDTIAMMRQLTPDEMASRLAEHEVAPHWRSIFVDGVLFPKQMRMLIAEGESSQVDTIVGSTRDESTTLFVGLPDLSRDDWEANLRKNLPRYADDLISAYESDIETSTIKATQEILSDSLFAAEMRTWAQLVEAKGNNAYLYVFNHAPPLQEYGRSLGAFHASEIQYIFQSHEGENTEDGLPVLWDESDRMVAQQIRAYWLNFAKTGNPNGDGLADWPAYSTKNNASLAIEEKPHTVINFRKMKLDLLEQIMRAGFAVSASNAE